MSQDGKNKSEPLEPAATVIRILGGRDVVAELTGLSDVQIWRWTQSRAKAGTDGRVPSKYQQRLLEWAKANQKPLQPAHFFCVPG